MWMSEVGKKKKGVKIFLYLSTYTDISTYTGERSANVKVYGREYCI